MGIADHVEVALAEARQLLGRLIDLETEMEDDTLHDEGAIEGEEYDRRIERCSDLLTAAQAALHHASADLLGHLPAEHATALRAFVDAQREADEDEEMGMRPEHRR